jgi:4-hydroxybenzoate polyprenyltransferase
MTMLVEILRTMRLHQWVKNLLVFVAMVAAHNVTHDAVLAAAAAFLCFGLCASSAYLINDLRDQEADRTHPRKRNRPFASGRLSPRLGPPVATMLAAAGLGIGYVTSPQLAIWLAVYVVVTLAYSMQFKRVPMLDVLVLAGLYTVRVIGGGAATGDPMTLWLLAFSMFLFTSLACVKRYPEIAAMEKSGAAANGRGYRPGEEMLLMCFGAAAGMASVITLALYMNSAVVARIYDMPQALWAVCPILLYWLGRMWMAALRGEMTDDPIVFAARDWGSWLMLAAMGAVVVVAWFG